MQRIGVPMANKRIIMIMMMTNETSSHISHQEELPVSAELTTGVRRHQCSNATCPDALADWDTVYGQVTIRSTIAVCT